MDGIRSRADAGRPAEHARNARRGRRTALIGRRPCAVRSRRFMPARGSLHGDIKAHNVMREEGGRTVLMDFGAGRPLIETTLPAGSETSRALRCLGSRSPRRQTSNRASDIYSLWSCCCSTSWFIWLAVTRSPPSCTNAATGGV